MLSEEEKREMLEDAADPQRREMFAQARRRSLGPMTWVEYFRFLEGVQNLFPQQKTRKVIEGPSFRL